MEDLRIKKGDTKIDIEIKRIKATQSKDMLTIREALIMIVKRVDEYNRRVNLIESRIANIVETKQEIKKLMKLFEANQRMIRVLRSQLLRNRKEIFILKDKIKKGKKGSFDI